jgi:DNA-binding SARP family transcriptional activator
MISAAAAWRIEMFGGLRATDGERTLTHFETRKVGVLLACLALDPRRAHSREALAELLWPEEDGEAIRNRLRQALSSLRRELEPPSAANGSVLIADRSEVSLNPAAITTDVAEFESIAADASMSEDPTERAALYRAAVALYRGELLPGCYEESLVAERERLSAAYRDILGRLAAALGEAGDLPGALEVARKAVAEDHLREDAHCELMRLYVAAGRTSEALRQYRELERILREELGAVPSAATQALLQEVRASGTPAALSGESPIHDADSLRPAADLAAQEPDGGAVPLQSSFYISRPTDREFHAAIARHASIVLVKGPRQVGKTSLLARGVQRARESGARVVLTDLQKLAPEQLDSAASLFRAFSEMIADQMDLDVSFDEVWNPRRGWNVNFERFMRREVLGAAESPLIWGMDEVDRLFGFPFSGVVFGLFRSWHNERSLNPDGPWGRLTLAIAYATEAHLFITDLNQSPFNVGTRLALEDFTRGEVQELNRLYGSPLTSADASAAWFELVGGHPYLARRGLHVMAEQGMDVYSMQAEACRDDGPFGDHLRRLAFALCQDETLLNAVRATLQGKPCPTLESFYRLRSAGVIVGRSPQDARMRCGLYRRFLEQKCA